MWARLKEKKNCWVGLHESFVGYVKSRRGAKGWRMNRVVTAAFWLGSQAAGFGPDRRDRALWSQKLKELYGDRPLCPLWPPPQVFQRFARDIGAGCALAGIERACVLRAFRVVT